MDKIEQADIGTARIGDIVRFKSYSLTVEEAELLKGGIRIYGSASNSSMAVRKDFMFGRTVTISRA